MCRLPAQMWPLWRARSRVPDAHTSGLRLGLTGNTLVHFRGAEVAHARLRTFAPLRRVQGRMHRGTHSSSETPEPPLIDSPAAHPCCATVRESSATRPASRPHARACACLHAWLRMRLRASSSPHVWLIGQAGPPAAARGRGSPGPVASNSARASHAAAIRPNPTPCRSCPPFLGQSHSRAVVAPTRCRAEVPPHRKQAHTLARC